MEKKEILSFRRSLIEGYEVSVTKIKDPSKKWKQVLKNSRKTYFEIFDGSLILKK